MAEFVMERWTRCETGNPADEKFFEVVLEDDDPRSIKDETPRITTLVRLFTRGDFFALKGRMRDALVTVGRRDSRTIKGLARISASDGHINVSLRPLGLTVTFPIKRGTPLPWDYYGGPASQVAPTLDLPMPDYLVRSRR